MNGKTTKLLNRFAAMHGANRRVVKRAWTLLPRRVRNKVRREMHQSVAANAARFA